MAVAMLLMPHPAYAAGQGDHILNSAWLSSTEKTSDPAEVEVTVVVRTPSTIELLNFAPTLPGATIVPIGATDYRSDSGGGVSFLPLPPPLPAGSTTTIDLGQPLSLTSTGMYHQGEPIFIRVTDLDQNIDRTVAETILITITDDHTGDVEVLRLTETGADTGTFSGFIQSTGGAAASSGGTLQVAEGGKIIVTYVDIIDGTDSSAAAALIDPLGVVFDSRTGLPVNGAAVTLWDIGLDRPATVLGDDGFSAYPDTVTTGATVSDSSGRTYTFSAGHFRFPFVYPGTYQLRVIPPAGYTAPSTVATADLQNLPGAPYAIVLGSRGEVFAINPGPALRIDIPLDPPTTGVWLQKSVGKPIAAIGDFVPYELSLQNFNTVLAATAVTLEDILPRGLRLVSGSVTVDGLAAPDPAISADGRILNFSLGAVPPTATVRIRYVVEVSVGSKPGPVVNVAVASYSAGLASNTARASLTIKDDFLRARSLILGNVYQGACGAFPGAEAKGLAGVRLYLEDGTFAVTDQAGRYHFEGVHPGLHVVQLDPETIPEGFEITPCEEGNRFAGAGNSQFVDLQGGTLWRADFQIGPRQQVELPVAPASGPLSPEPEMANPAAGEPLLGSASLRLTSNSDGKQAMTFTATAVNSSVPLPEVLLLITLPVGVAYLPGSSVLDETPLGDPVVDGRTLTYDLGKLEAGSQRVINLQGTVDPLAAEEQPAAAATLILGAEGNKVIQATAEAKVLYRLDKNLLTNNHNFVFYPHFDSGQDTLLPEDRAALDKIAAKIRNWEIKKIVIVGHTDNRRLSPPTKKRFADNMGLSRARAKAVSSYLASGVDLAGADLLEVGMGKNQPVASNATEEGKARNRRVEIHIETLERIRDYRILPVIPDSGEQMVETRQALVVPEPLPLPVPEAVAPEAVATGATGSGQVTVEKGVGILSPAADSILINATNVVRVRLDSKLKPLLLVDGVEIGRERIGFSMVDPETKRTLYSYIGVGFGGAGAHNVVLRGLDPFGNKRFEETIRIQRSGEIRSIRQIEEGVNVADGKTPVRLRLEMRDENDVVIRAPLRLEFLSDQLRSAPRTRELADLEAVDAKGNLVQVDADGWATFAPTSTTGLYRGQIRFNELKAELSTYVKPHLREWILVGLAEGTAGYNTISGHLDPLQDSDIEEDFYEEGRIAFFAKGKVKGEWLLTAAYDTGKDHEESLHGIIRPDTYYTLYGDASQPFADAPSSRKLYLKIEREQFYALFGDYDTGLTVTELSRYSRSLTGFKTEYLGNMVSLKAFAAETRQSYVRDEIPGDGTSGRYHLSRSNIVLNSEKLTIETRDRFHSEVVLNSRPLNRTLDYEINYDNGTIFFKEAIPSRDDKFNPLTIVVEYESLQSQETALDFGGRAAFKPFGEVLEVGATYVREGASANQGELAGMDAKLVLGKATTLTAEAAGSSTKLSTGERNGSAWLAMVEHRTTELDGKVYVRENGEGFGLGQQAGSEQGMRKIGGSGRYRLDETITVGGELSRESNLTSGGDRDLAQADVQFTEKTYTVGGGLREAVDHPADGEKNSSSQVFVTGSRSLTPRLKVRLSHDQSLAASGGESANYPTRTVMGADYQLSQHTALFAEQEFTFGAAEDSNMTRLGLKATPWNGSEVSSRIEQQSTEYGPRVFASTGLKQTWQLDQTWSVDAGLDRSETLRHPGNPVGESAVPASGGREDFTAISVGANRKNQSWIWSNRLEQRFSDSEDKFGLYSGVEGDVREGLALSGKAQIFNSTRSSGPKQLNGDLRGGLVWRPAKTRWIILDRIDFLFNRQSGTEFNFSNWRVVNNLNLNFRPDWLTQVALQYGAKYVHETIDNRSYSGYSDLLGIEGRQDFAKKWDIGLQAQTLNSWQSGQRDYRLAPSVGYSVVKNVWLSVGYNVVGFTDRDFSAADFTAEGPFVKFRFKFDQASVREALQAL